MDDTTGAPFVGCAQAGELYLFVRGVCDVIHAVGVGSERVKGGVRRIIGKKGLNPILGGGEL